MYSILSSYHVNYIISASSVFVSLPDIAFWRKFIKILLVSLDWLFYCIIVKIDFVFVYIQRVSTAF